MTIRTFAHRHGIARVLNYGTAAAGYQSAHVQTAIPSERLARWAIPRELRWSADLIGSERRGRLHWRWRFRKW